MIQIKDLQASINIKASAETIWDILIDVKKWKLWDRDVKHASLDGHFKVGGRGTLVSKDDKVLTFYITEIVKNHYYSNYYELPFFTKLHFTHRIESFNNYCEVTFVATFKGPLKYYYFFMQENNIQSTMKRALENLKNFCTRR